MRCLRLIPAAGIGALVGAVALAQPTIPTYTVDAGGVRSVGGGYTLRGSIGQPDAGPPRATGGGYVLAGGFVTATLIECPADFNGDGALTVADFTAFRSAYLSGHGSADFNGDDALTVADFTAFRNAYIAGCP